MYVFLKLRDGENWKTEKLKIVPVQSKRYPVPNNTDHVKLAHAYSSVLSDFLLCLLITYVSCAYHALGFT
jgi:hypothetical protein